MQAPTRLGIHLISEQLAIVISAASLTKPCSCIHAYTINMYTYLFPTCIQCIYIILYIVHESMILPLCCLSQHATPCTGVVAGNMHL